MGIKCHLCGMTGGHTRQCGANIRVDPEALNRRLQIREEWNQRIKKIVRPKIK